VQRDGVLQFLGVPYAAPPVGDLRFRPPAATPSWDGFREASEFGAACPQPTFGMKDFFGNLTRRAGLSWWRRGLLWAAGGTFGFPSGEEDCLTLNVWTPSVDGALPVMFWIHGGGHTAGSGSLLPTIGVPYATRGVVIVSINYRLGVFGYLAHPALIAGGDPSRVTIFGESAGAMSVAQLMASPLARDLFHGAIAQSGTAAHQFLDLHDARGDLAAATRSGELVLDALGEADASDPAGVLRAASVDDLQDAFEAYGDELTFLLHPNVDGWVLEAPVAWTFREGRQAPVPLLLGFTANEGSLLYDLTDSPLWAGPPVENASDWTELIDERFDGDADDIASHYRVESDDDVEAAGEAMLGDSLFGAPTLFTARTHAAAGNPVHLYFLTREPPSPRQTAGAYHGSDLQFVFDSPLPLFPWTDTDRALAAAVVDYWVAFANEGAPLASERLAWPAFDSSNPHWMEFGNKVGVARAERLDRFELLERHLIAPFLGD